MNLSQEQILLASFSALLLSVTAVSSLPISFSMRLPRRRSKEEIKIGSEYISDDDRKRHTHIVGATGSGKTVLIEEILFQDLKRGLGALIIDPKGDRSLYERIKNFCAAIGREEDLNLLSATYSEESVKWNPCRLGNASELQTKFFNSAIYSEPHYAKACELALLRIFQKLSIQPKKAFTLKDVSEQLERLSKEEKNETLKGLYFDLANLTQGEWASLLCAKEPTHLQKEISIFDIIRKNEILFIDLPTESKAVQSSRLGRLILQELLLVSGLRKAFPNLKSERPFSVFVDEFDAFATESFSYFLNKGRSSDFMIHLSHQTLSDLRKVSETFAGQILGNCNVRFIFRQDDPDDAETWSRFIGTRKSIQRTFQTRDGSATGLSSNRETQEFKVHPDLIKDLKTGECIFSAKTKKISKLIRIPFEQNKKIKINGPTIRPQTLFKPTTNRLERDCEEYSHLFQSKQKPQKKESK